MQKSTVNVEASKEQIDGFDTDIIISTFVDRIFVTISQTGKLGTLVLFLMSVMMAVTLLFS
jgi:hypothetical protein